MCTYIQEDTVVNGNATHERNKLRKTDNISYIKTTKRSNSKQLSLGQRKKTKVDTCDDSESDCDMVSYLNNAMACFVF